MGRLLRPRTLRICACRGAEGGRKGSGWRETPPLPGCELTQEKRTCTLRPQEGKQGCKLMLSTICLGEKAKEGMNLVEILPPANQEDKKSKPITTASLQASVLPMAVTMGFEISPPVTFQLQAGSGPVVLSGQEYHWRPEGAPRRWQVNTSAPVLGRLRSILGRGGGGGCVPGGGEPLRTSQEAGAPEADQRRQEEKGGRRGGSKTQS
ncbi:Nucleoplasmin-2 [Manis javanica]|nr:Nucleoplasmin-2 [Manis javanica]